MALQLFISYSSKDGAWLEELLPFLMSVRNSLNLQIWQDAVQLNPGDAWDAKIREAVLNSRICLLLVSQSYLASEYVNKVELPKIIELHQKQQSTIFWVPVGASIYESTPLKDIQAAIGNPATPLEELNLPQRNRLWKELATRLQEHVLRMKEGAQVEKRKIYLSEPAAEAVLRSASERVRKELWDYGYRLVPEQPLPARRAEAEVAIREAMEGADLLLGLFGSRIPPHGFELLKLEHEIAASSNTPRLLWLPNSEQREGEAESFAAAVRDYGDKQTVNGGAVVRLTPGYQWRSSHLDAFLEDVHSILKKKREELSRAFQDDGPPTIYLVCAEQNHPAYAASEAAAKVESIKAYIEDEVQRQGRRPYSVLLPPVPVADLDDLLDAEGFILYWGDGDYKTYFWNNLQVLQKAVGKRAANSKPYRAKILYLTDPKLRDKTLYPKHRFNVVEQYGDGAFQPNALEQFL